MTNQFKKNAVGSEKTTIKHAQTQIVKPMG